MGIGIKTIAAILTFSAVTHSTAEQRTAVPGSILPEALCLQCEVGDLGKSASCTPRTTDNYCACRQTTESALLILVRANRKSPFIDFDQYQSTQLKILAKRLKKRGIPKTKTKQALGTLRKKLEVLRATYKSSCGGNSTTPTPPTEQAETIAHSSYTVQLLSLSGQRHSFANAISPQGRVLGGAYQNEGNSRAPAMPHGLTQAQFVNEPTTPVVWGSDGTKTGCATCPNGLYFVDLNDQGIAVGSRHNAASPSQEAFLFDYTKQAVSLIPTSSSGISLALSVNDAGVIVGQIQRPGRSLPNGNIPTDAVSWIGSVETVLDRAALIAAHSKELAPVMLANIKAGLKEAQDTNGCGDGEIEQTELIAEPTYHDVTTISAIKVTSRGDILGNILAPRVTWNFVGPCQQGEGLISIVASTFVRRLDGTLSVIPGPMPMYPKQFLGIPMDINSNLTVVGPGIMASRIGNLVATLQVSQAKPAWQELATAGLPFLQSFQPVAINERGDIIGMYLSVEPAASTPRAFAIVGGSFVDLTSLLGSQSDWVIETASDINSCGQIVGRARSAKTGVNRAILVSPNGCPLVK